MKGTKLTFMILLTAFSVSLWANSTKQRFNFNKMDISGKILEEEVEEDDPELLQLDRELRKNQKAVQSYAQKTEKYSKLSEVVEDMSEKHRDYFAQKSNYESTVGQYNKQIDCTQKPDHEGCDKILKSSSERRISREKDQQLQENFSQQVYDIFKSQEFAFQNCFQKHLRSGSIPNSSSPVQMVLEFTVDQYGRVKNPKVMDQAFFASQGGMVDCFIMTLQSLDFPEPKFQDKVTIRQPIHLYVKNNE